MLFWSSALGSLEWYLLERLSLPLPQIHKGMVYIVHKENVCILYIEDFKSSIPSRPSMPCPKGVTVK